MAPDLAAAVAGYERSGGQTSGGCGHSGAEPLPALLRAGVRVARCHDVALAERLLLGRDGRGGEPASLAAAYARLRGAPCLPGRPRRAAGRRLGWRLAERAAAPGRAVRGGGDRDGRPEARRSTR